MIPQVRKWRVKYWSKGKVTHSAIVDTINKRFAKWIANEKLGYPAFKSDKITVSLAKKGA